MKHTHTLAILAFVCLAACQQSTAPVASLTVLNEPATDDLAALELAQLSADFPIIGEMVLPKKPSGCGLSKTFRDPSLGDVAAKAYDSRYVFTYQGSDEATDEPIYQIGVNGELRAVKQSGSADRGGNTIRYFKTVEGPEVEVLVSIRPSAGSAPSTGTFGRIKAWDEDTPLMCGYNIIQVAGDCEL